MAKRTQGIDFMRYIPIAVMAVSLVSGYTLLQAKVSSAENRIDKMEVVQAKVSADTSDIRVSQAKTEARLDSIYDAIQNLKK